MYIYTYLYILMCLPIYILTYIYLYLLIYIYLFTCIYIYLYDENRSENAWLYYKLSRKEIICSSLVISIAE